jgi:hypothetical protein
VVAADGCFGHLGGIGHALAIVFWDAVFVVVVVDPRIIYILLILHLLFNPLII